MFMWLSPGQIVDACAHSMARPASMPQDCYCAWFGGVRPRQIFYPVLVSPATELAAPSYYVMVDGVAEPLILALEQPTADQPFQISDEGLREHLRSRALVRLFPCL